MIRSALFTCLLVSVLGCFGRPITITDQYNDYEVLAFQTQLLEDPNGTLLFDEIIESDNFNYQDPTKPINPNPDSYYWLKLDLKGDTNTLKKWVLEVYNVHINYLELYKPITEYDYAQTITGASIPFGNREYQHINFVFDIDLKYNGIRPFYIRLKSKNPIWFQAHIKDQAYFSEYAVNEYGLLGFFYGILFIMMLYNLLIYFSTREKVYLYYVIYVASCAFLSMVEDGMGFAFLWNNTPAFGQYAVNFNRLLLLLFFVLYSREFLNSKNLLPKMDQALVGALLFYLTYFTVEHSFPIANYLGAYFPLVNYSIFLLPFCIVFLIGCIVWRKNYKPSKYFVLGFVLVLVSIVVVALRDRGFTVGSIIGNILLVYSLNIGIVLQIAFLSKSLADRLRFLKEENEKAQEEKIVQLEENERLKDSINKELEHKVAIRTKELEEKNRNIMDSIAYAQRIQTAILPSKEKLKDMLGPYFVFFRPKDIVSGDFYWVHEIEGKVLFAVIDCTGHGVPGALMTVMAHNLLHEIVVEQKFITPNEILNQLDKKLRSRIKQNPDEFSEQYGMEMGICLLDRNTGKLQYAGAIHDLLIVSKNKEEFVLRGDRFPVGESHLNPENKLFSLNEVTVLKGQKLYLSSDGYKDQFGGPEQQKFMAEPFKSLLLNSSDQNFAEQFSTIKTTLETWQGSLPQIDDILVLCVRV